MALMTTSGSIPFSFASASIVCCNGFDILSFQLSALGCRLELHFQIGPRNHSEWHAVCLPIIGLDHHVGAVEPAELSPEKSLAVDFLAHHDLRAAAGEPPVVVGPP